MLKIEYYEANHMGVIRKYVKQDVKRLALMKLTGHATITSNDAVALKRLGFKLVKVEAPGN